MDTFGKRYFNKVIKSIISKKYGIYLNITLLIILTSMSTVCSDSNVNQLNIEFHFFLILSPFSDQCGGSDTMNTFIEPYASWYYRVLIDIANRDQKVYVERVHCGHSGLTLMNFG